MTPPTTYAEWSVLLDRFGAGDDTALPVMAAGRLEGGAVVSERWARRLMACQDQRLTRLNDQLAVMLKRDPARQALSTVLIVVRKGLVPLRAFAAIEALPQDVGDYLLSQIDDWANRQQASLEGSAAARRNDRDAVLKVLRDTPLTAAAPAPVNSQATPPPSGRRVIL